MQNMKSSGLNMLLLVTCWTMLTHSTLAAVMPVVAANDAAYVDAAIDGEAKGSADALTLHKRPSFFVGSRYGRSSAAQQGYYAPSKTRRLSVMPRNDRFFLGSRYGKRAGEFMSPYEQGLAAAASEMTGNAIGSNTNNLNDSTPPNMTMMMTCIYTGHRNLYRCNSVEEINSIINELTAAGRHGIDLDSDVDVGVGVDDNNNGNGNNHVSN